MLRAYGISVQSYNACEGCPRPKRSRVCDLRIPAGRPTGRVRISYTRFCCSCNNHRHYSCNDHSPMEDRPVFTNSNRTLSASVLKDRLSKLSVAPLRPVAALQARVECVHSCTSCRRSLLTLTPKSVLSRVQLCSSEHSSSAQAANCRSGAMDQHDTDLLFLHAPSPVRALF